MSSSYAKVAEGCSTGAHGYFLGKLSTRILIEYTRILGCSKGTARQVLLVYFELPSSM